MDKYVYTKNHYNNTVVVRNIVDYVDKTLSYLEENKEDKKANEDEFKEKNDDVKFGSDK